MKERINRLAKGVLDSELPKMICSPEKIEETIRINSVAARDLLIVSDNGLNIKGLVYSSNPRVRIPAERNAFGGLRNHIAYEIDTSFLVTGDEIRGKFYLITNCGEREIPYTFYVDLASSGRVLGELKTAEDFLHLVEQDMDTALRLLEYQDFLEAPFMQDLRIRSLYDGLKGHGSRQNFMEEFLIALGVKEPIRLTIEENRKCYENPQNEIEDFITIQTDHWGYVYLEASADGEFIHLPKKSATQADFQDGSFKLPVRILPERLHAGKNYGRISVSTPREEKQIVIEVSNGTERKRKEQEVLEKHWCDYLCCRLDYECDPNGQAHLTGRMQKDLDQIRMTCSDPALLLFQAELDLLSGRTERAGTIIGEIQNDVLRQYAGSRLMLCFLQYIQVCIWDDPEQKNTLIRLLQKYCSEDERKHRDIVLYLMLLRVNRELFENPGTVLISMEQEFKDGCKSPFLYNECLKLFRDYPALLRGLGKFETQVLSFGVKKRLISPELAKRISEVAGYQKVFKQKHLRLLTDLYEIYKEPELLLSVCTLLIKGNCQEQKYFRWYHEGVCAGLGLTRLYEFYLHTLPESYDRLLPKEIFLYFSYARELDQQNRCVLYANLLRYGDRKSELYHEYEREIEQFAIHQLFERHMDQNLAVIYREIICKELIDRQLARTLPEILCSHKILCRDPKMNYVIVRHEELMKEVIYPLWDGEVYLPLFSERDVLLFEDSYGNRYLDIDYEEIPVMEQSGPLLERCFEMYPEHPMLLINACCSLTEKESLDSGELAFLEQAEQKIELHPLFRKRIVSAIIQHYIGMTDHGAEQDKNLGLSYLQSLNKDFLTREERNGVCETFIRQNHDAEAYAMICRYGTEGMRAEYLQKLAIKMVLQKLFDEDDRLLQLAWTVFEEEKADSILLDYLCEHFNGAVEQMYAILIQSLKEHVETYDLEERLLAQMLFTGNKRRMDQVFEIYISRKKSNDSIVRAYFTMKSMSYFLEDNLTGDKVFSYLESAVNTAADKEKVPDIYLLALTKYYATLPELNPKQKELCQTVVDVLSETGMIFAYFKELSRSIQIPDRLQDKELIEYHGKKDIKPYLQLRILPGEQEFHTEELRPVYRGIYVKEKVLFEGETLEYRIFEEKNGIRQQTAEGKISCREKESSCDDSRFACLNAMNFSFELKNETALLESMRNYQMKDEAVRELFTLR